MVSRSLFVGHRHAESPATATDAPAPGRRWGVLASFLAVSAGTQLMWLAYAPIASQLQAMTGLSEGQVVLLSSVFPLLYIPLSIPVGRIIDRYGFRTATLIGAGLTAGGAVLRVLSPTFAVLLAGSLVIAVGQPFVLNSATKLTAAWFPGRDAGTANGLFVASLFAGMIISLGLTPALFEVFGGTSTRSSLNRVAFVYAVIAVAGWLWFTVAGRERAGGPDIRTAPAGSWSTVKALLRVRGFVPLVLAACAGIGAMIAYLQLVEELLASKGISDTTAGAMGALFVVGGAAGSFLISAAADRLGRHSTVLAAALVATAVGLVAMAAFRQPLALCAIGAVLTAAVAATWPLSLTLSEELTGLATAGMSASLVLLFGNLAGVLLTLAMEQLHGSGGAFTSATVFLAVVCALGAVPAARIRAAPVGAHSTA